jgi:hypothetical protein
LGVPPIRHPLLSARRSNVAIWSDQPYRSADMLARMILTKLAIIVVVEPFQFLDPPSILLVGLDPASHSFFTNLNEAFR